MKPQLKTDSQTTATSRAPWSPFDAYFATAAAEELLEHLHATPLNRDARRAAHALADAIGYGRAAN